MLLKFFFDISSRRSFVKSDEWELVQLLESDPNHLAYSQRSQVKVVNLDLVLFSCQTCFIFISLFSDINIAYSGKPIYLSR